MKSQSVTTAVKWKNNPRTQFSLVWKESIAVENFYFLLIGNGNKQQQQKPTNNRISNKNAIASNTPRLSSVWLDASDCGSTKTTRLLHNALAIFWDRLLFLFFFSCPCCLSAWWLLTCRSTNHSCGIPTGRERFLSEGPRRTIWATIFHCILQENKIQTIWFFIFFTHRSCVRQGAHICCLWRVDIAVQCCQFSVFSPRCFGDSEEKKRPRTLWSSRFCSRAFWFSSMLWGVGALPSGEGGRFKVCVEPGLCCSLLLLLLLYCEGCGAVLSALLSWAAGGLLLQGPLLPRAGELLKSSSSSRPLVASYCVFSRRVIRRSSSSPNSPPIRVGSPTTITSCRDESRAERAFTDRKAKGMTRPVHRWARCLKGRVVFKLRLCCLKSLFILPATTLTHNKVTAVEQCFRESSATVFASRLLFIPRFEFVANGSVCVNISTDNSLRNDLKELEIQIN